MRLTGEMQKGKAMKNWKYERQIFEGALKCPISQKPCMGCECAWADDDGVCSIPSIADNNQHLYQILNTLNDKLNQILKDA